MSFVGRIIVFVLEGTSLDLRYVVLFTSDTSQFTIRQAIDCFLLTLLRKEFRLSPKHCMQQ